MIEENAMVGCFGVAVSLDFGVVVAVLLLLCCYCLSCWSCCCSFSLLYLCWPLGDLELRLAEMFPM